MNKEIVLREYLAIERTKMANETTLLAYIRTGLYFVVAGSTLGHIVETTFWKIVEMPLIFVGLSIMVMGIIRHRKVSKAIQASRKNVGESAESFIRAARGEI
jgi:putative membrane protein